MGGIEPPYLFLFQVWPREINPLLFMIARVFNCPVENEWLPGAQALTLTAM